jgi:predicted phage tail protein
VKKVSLEGVLGDRFGREWSLDVRTPAEALRAIGVQARGFLEFLRDAAGDGIAFRILLDEEEIGVDRLAGPYSAREVFRVVPVPAGAASDGLKIVLGAVLVAAAVIMSGPIGGAAVNLGAEAFAIAGMKIAYGSIAMFGVALMASGISMAMTKTPEVGDLDTAENKASYLFNGPVNTLAQGGPVPIGYGRLTVGATLISGGIAVNQIMAYSEAPEYAW